MPQYTITLAVALLQLASLPAEANIFQQFEKCNIDMSSNETYTFNIWIFVPFEPNYKFCKDRVQPALDKAYHDAIEDIKKVNSRSLLSVLNRTNFFMEYKDTKCDADVAFKTMLITHDERLSQTSCNITEKQEVSNDIIIGMSCDYAAGRASPLANHWNWPLIYPGTRTQNYLQKEDTECCTTMVRPGLTRSDFGHFVTDFFKRHQWNMSLIVYSKNNSHGAHVSSTTNTDCGTAIGGITDSFREEGWLRYDYYDYEERNTDQDLEADLPSILKELKITKRVSLWCVGRRTMRRVMSEAEKLNMTGGDFAFIYIDLYNSNASYYWTDDDDNLAKDTSNPDDVIDITKTYTNEYLRALTVFTLRTPTNQSQYKEFSDFVKGEIAKNSNDTIMEYNQYVNPFISLYYDAMTTFMYGLVKSFCNGFFDITDGEQFAKTLWGVEFESIGRNVTIPKTGDRKMDYVVMDMNKDTSKFQIAFIYRGATSEWERLRDIDWPNSKPPENIPKCGYSNEKCSLEIPADKTLMIAIIVVVVVLIFAFVVVLVLYRKRKAELRLQKKYWKVRWDEIEWSQRRSNSFSDTKSSHSVSSSIGSQHTYIGKQVFAKIGSFRGRIVAVKDIKRKRVLLDRYLLMELEEIYNIDHNHICKFVGAVDDAPHGASILTEYCSRGSLQDFLEDNMEYEMKDFFKNSLISDIISGMSYLHRSFFKCHGNLKSSNCLIDNRFQVKLTDFGLMKLREGSRTDSVTGFKYYENKLWSAPEFLRSMLTHTTPKGDVYSFAIVVQEIIYRKGVFYTKAERSPQEILYQITCPPINEPPFRPTLEDEELVHVDPRLRSLIQKCWMEDPQDRPTFQEIEKEFKRLKQKKNLVDSLLERLDNYSSHLEEKVDEKTHQLRAEKDRADTLLYQMLPEAVAEQLKKGNTVLPTAYDSVTIFFSDIVGFTAISHGSKPMQVVSMLNDLYTMFDQIIDKFDVYKVETIGDAYMVVSGLPERNGNRHAREIAKMALSLMDCVEHRFKISHMPNTQLKLRVGIHTGPVVAGVVGLKMPRYCLFGDTVNTASRMESNGKAFAIHISPKTKEVLDYFESFLLEEREDEVFLKGLGTWKTWWLKGESQLEHDPTTSDHEENEDKDLFKSSPPFTNAVAPILKFDSKSPIARSNYLASPNSPHWQSIINKASPPLMKGFQGITTDSPMPTSNGPRRHRTGVVKSNEFTDYGSGVRERREKISQLNMELISSAGNTWQSTPTPSIKTGRKVQFDSVSHTNENLASTVNFRKSKKCGRDSGIGMGFDNPSCLEDLSSEDDYL